MARPNVPPPGYVACNGTVAPGGCVADYAARRQVVKAGCRTRGCNRHITLDPEVLSRDGMGALAMRKIQQLWKCNRIDGCGLEFHNERPGVPLMLGHFVGLPHVRIRLRCREAACEFARVYPVEALIKGLAARKQGDERTEIEVLPGKMTSACPVCKKANWTADVLWADTETLGWRTHGAATFDRYGTG